LLRNANANEENQIALTDSQLLHVDATELAKELLDKASALQKGVTQATMDAVEEYTKAKFKDERSVFGRAWGVIKHRDRKKWARKEYSGENFQKKYGKFKKERAQIREGLKTEAEKEAFDTLIEAQGITLTAASTSVTGPQFRKLKK